VAGIEMSVLARLKFSSVALPSRASRFYVISETMQVRVSANDPMLWSLTKADGWSNQSERST